MIGEGGRGRRGLVSPRWNCTKNILEGARRDRQNFPCAKVGIRMSRFERNKKVIKLLLSAIRNFQSTPLNPEFTVWCYLSAYKFGVTFQVSILVFRSKFQLFWYGITFQVSRTVLRSKFQVRHYVSSFNYFNTVIRSKFHVRHFVSSVEYDITFQVSSAAVRSKFQVRYYVWSFDYFNTVIRFKLQVPYYVPSFKYGITFQILIR